MYDPKYNGNSEKTIIICNGVRKRTPVQIIIDKREVRRDEGKFSLL